eukprot:CAMPEP_0194041664 /NCGR_PEP_ID=MMETSP0009_2-20130614/13538_1 /TAXON_ID=210454 /ORGANISM="Grammatophora oceanica, Strain CCMP 410" /LENGTH=107 /DNA_ID=CAMNT_0038685247 /DNA_START=204 /DNA_END=524 /DNA_ORIENTATION=-
MLDVTTGIASTLIFFAGVGVSRAGRLEAVDPVACETAQDGTEEGTCIAISTLLLLDNTRDGTAGGLGTAFFGSETRALEGTLAGFALEETTGLLLSFDCVFFGFDFF